MHSRLTEPLSSSCTSHVGYLRGPATFETQDNQCTSCAGMLLASRKLLGEEQQLPGAAASPVASGSHFSGQHISGQHISGRKQQPLSDAHASQLKSLQERLQHANERLDSDTANRQGLLERLKSLEQEAAARILIRDDLAKDTASLKTQLEAATAATELRDQELKRLREAASTARQAAAPGDPQVSFASHIHFDLHKQG